MGLMSTIKTPVKPAEQKPAPQNTAEDKAEVVPGAHTGRHPMHEAGGAAGGAIVGGVLGSIAGPAGAAAGALIGGVVGAVAAKISDEEADRMCLRDGELDDEIGINGGDLGAPNLKHPPAVRGTYSGASAGAGGGARGSTSGGPMQRPED